MLPLHCCCDGKLDLYEQGTTPTSHDTFYRRSSAYDAGDATEVSRWSIAMTTEGIIRDAVATWGDQVFEMVDDDGSPSSTYYLTRYNVAARSVVWNKALSTTPTSTDPMMLFAGPDHTGVIRNDDGSTYEIWDASGNLDYRTGFTAGGIQNGVVGAKHFSPRYDDYTSTDIQEGVVPIPQNVSRWNYPACVGWRVTSISFGTWIIAGAGIEDTTCDLTYQLVAGELDWSVEDAPHMTVDTVLETYTETNKVVRGLSANTDAEKEAAVLENLVRWLNGEYDQPNNIGRFLLGAPADEIFPASIRANGALVSPSKDFERMDRHGSGVVGYEKHMNGEHGYLRPKSDGDYEVRIDGTVEDTLDIGFITTASDMPYSFISVPSSDIAFVVTWKSDDDTIAKIRAYESDGTIAWTESATNSTSRGQAMCASDRYIYVATFVQEWAAKIGANLPDFTSATKNSLYDSDEWCDWAISLDGTRWNPARVDNSGLYERFTSGFSTSLGHMDCIKDSSLIYSPPDDWF